MREEHRRDVCEDGDPREPSKEQEDRRERDAGRAAPDVDRDRLGRPEGPDGNDLNGRVEEEGVWELVPEVCSECLPRVDLRLRRREHEDADRYREQEVERALNALREDQGLAGVLGGRP